MCLTDSPGFLLMSDASGISYYFTLSDILQPITFVEATQLIETAGITGNVYMYIYREVGQCSSSYMYYYFNTINSLGVGGFTEVYIT